MTGSARLAAAGMTTSTIVALTAGLSMLQPLSTDLYLPTLPAIASHFDASVATVQWTLSVFIAVFGLWQLVAGPLTDRYGRYPLIISSFVPSGRRSPRPAAVSGMRRSPLGAALREHPTARSARRAAWMRIAAPGQRAPASRRFAGASRPIAK